VVSRLGLYCSYCERRVVTNLAVEHIQPKDGPHGHPHLIGRWENFLLACVNCNSTKRDKNVVLANVFLPDRDNTFAAFSYLPDGTVQPAATLATALMGKASDTLALTGLDKKISVALDEHGKPGEKNGKNSFVLKKECFTGDIQTENYKAQNGRRKKLIPGTELIHTKINIVVQGNERRAMRFGKHLPPRQECRKTNQDDRDKHKPAIRRRSCKQIPQGGKRGTKKTLDGAHT